MHLVHRIIVVALLACLNTLLLAQTNVSAVLWQNAFGGSMLDGLDGSNSGMVAKYDPNNGNYLIVGLSNSPVSGQKTAAHFGMQDIWAVAYDGAGNMLWDKTYGGSGNEEFNSLILHSSGSYLLIGSSNSPVSGNKSTPNHPAAWAQRDIWIVKTDNAGNILWDKVFGGNRHESAFDAIETADGGIVVVGYTESPASNDISTPTYGSEDGWAFKIDANGNLLWEKRLGGNMWERIMTVTELPDQSLILSGPTLSTASGLVSSNGHGGADYWVLRLSANGNILWDKRFGSDVEDYPTCAIQAHNGDVIIGGFSGGGVGGTKTDVLRGQIDYWLIQVDAAGNQVWDKTYGGDLPDMPRTLAHTCDGGYVIGGASESNAGFEKSENARGNTDFWTVKIDGSGNLKWNTTLGGHQGELHASTLQKSNGRYLLHGLSNSSISGDKTIATQGNYDFWLMEVYLKAGFEVAQDSACTGTPFSFQNTSTRITERWEWNFGDPASGASNLSALPNPSHTFSGPGTYTVTQIVFEGCQTPDTMRMTITVLPTDFAAAIPDRFACLGDPVSIGTAPITGVTYQWSPAQGLDDPSLANPTLTVSQTQTFTLTASNGFCTDQATVTVTAAQASAGPDMMGCDGEDVTLEGSATAGMNIVWSPANLLGNPNGLTPTHTVSQNQSFTMTAIIPGCTIVDEVLVELAPDPIGTISFSPNPAQEGEPVAFTAQGQGIVAVTWNFGDGSFANAEPVLHAFDAEGNYQVEAILMNMYGCSTVVSGAVTVGPKPRVFIPTAFSPNGDGINDELQVSHRAIQTFDLLIFDRTGRLVYETADPNFSWDGTFAGKALPEGVYAVRMQVVYTDGRQDLRTGSVTIIR